MSRYDPSCCSQCGIEVGGPAPRKLCEDCAAVVQRGNAAFLAREVERYLDSPGCNVPARQQATRRLRWALDKFKEGATT